MSTAHTIIAYSVPGAGICCPRNYFEDGVVALNLKPRKGTADATKRSCSDTSTSTSASTIQSLTINRYQKALAYCNPTITVPCRQIYRNWHPEDKQRRPKQLKKINDSKNKHHNTNGNDDGKSNISSNSNDSQSSTQFLMSYPAEKYALKREDDYSPIVNQNINMLGLFFCATAAPSSDMKEEQVQVEDGEGGEAEGKGKGGPVITSPYGKARYQVPFEDLQERMFPSFHLYFADHYQVLEDWYVQLVVVPSWNFRLEAQCRQQGLILLDIDSNPFFFRVENKEEVDEYSNNARNPDTADHQGQEQQQGRRQNQYQYRVNSSPKLWIELLVGCDVIPISEGNGEMVESQLHSRVRKTKNSTTNQQDRDQCATILENVAMDLTKLAQELRQGSGVMDPIVTGLAFELSMLRTRLGAIESTSS
ncbi:hypothetical protein BGX28_008336 [Mortierella sp. GBA30]|nr:hypothetical protein BGX28_008336 [Mortierella sp. GBA30]